MCSASSSSVGRPLQAVLEFGETALDLAGSGPHRTRHPVEGPQLIEDGALDAIDGVGLELVAALEIELVDGVDEPEGPVGHKILRVDVARQPGSETAGDELDQRRVVKDETLTGLGIRSP